MNIILEGVVGSTAYGLAHADSDIDKLGIFQADNRDLLGLNKPDETRVTTDPDTTYHEVGKFVRLCLANNPTVMELLWLPEHTYWNDAGELLVDHREQFLSQQVRNTYGGYALQQKKRLMERGDFKSKLKKRTEKHGRHCMRLIFQGINILKTGELRVQLTQSEIETCRTAGILADTDQEAFANMFDMWDEEFRNTKSDLPEKPDWNAANNLLLRIREV
jgi:predicted nucleotidyltransferase